MKAIVLTRFGPPDRLQLQDVAKPTPKDHEVLIRIRATTVTTGDCDMRGLRLPLAGRLIVRIYLGRKRPIILGQEFAGDVEAVGIGVTRFREGDPVFGWTGFRLGAYAEYTCQPEGGVMATKPSNVTYEEAAPLPVGGLDATYFLRRARIRSGERMLIVGAGGSIGTFAVQLAKHFGAEVTAVDNTEKLDMLRSIGADHVVDYTREDVIGRGGTYDVIFDVIGKSPFSRSIRLLAPHGRYLMGNPRRFQRLRARWASKRGAHEFVPWALRTAREYADDIRALKELIAAGKVRTVIDRRYPLEQLAEAHRYSDTGRKKGNIVITVDRSFG